MPTLRHLLDGPHDVVVAVSQPDRGRGRGRKFSPSPVSERALDAGVPLLRPANVGEPGGVDELASFSPDLGVVVAFGQFIPKKVRELPALGYCINGHASLLPRHRGAAPIAHAILAGDAKTGITVMRVEREMDTGAMALVRETPIRDDDTTGTLSDRLADLAADSIAAAVDAIAAGALEWTEQDAARATLAPKIEREDARLTFTEPGRALALRVRAMAPKPGAFSTLGGEPLRILEALAEPGERGPDLRPGTIARDGPGLRIACADGWLVPLRLQRAGGKPLATVDFLRGRDLKHGSVLGEGAG